MWRSIDVEPIDDNRFKEISSRDLKPGEESIICHDGCGFVGVEIVSRNKAFVISNNRAGLARALRGNLQVEDGSGVITVDEALLEVIPPTRPGRRGFSISRESLVPITRQDGIRRIVAWVPGQ